MIHTDYYVIICYINLYSEVKYSEKLGLGFGCISSIFREKNQEQFQKGIFFVKWDFIQSDQLNFSKKVSFFGQIFDFRFA